MASRLSAATAALLALAAATLAVASLIHFGVRVPLGAATVVDPFAGAALPEALIAAVAAAGAVSGATLRAATWAPLAATLFAAAGVIVGMTFTLRGGRAGDIAYHACLFAVLLAALGLQLLSRRAPRPA